MLLSATAYYVVICSALTSSYDRCLSYEMKQIKIFATNQVEIIESPKWPDGYGPRKNDCRWVISTYDNHTLGIRFHPFFAITPTAMNDCSKDFLKLQQELGKPWIKTCAYQAPEPNITESNFLYVIFNSSPGMQNEGFRFVVQMDKIPDHVPGPLVRYKIIYGTVGTLAILVLVALASYVVYKIFCNKSPKLNTPNTAEMEEYMREMNMPLPCNPSTSADRATKVTATTTSAATATDAVATSSSTPPREISNTTNSNIERTDDEIEAEPSPIPFDSDTDDPDSPMNTVTIATVYNNHDDSFDASDYVKLTLRIPPSSTPTGSPDAEYTVNAENNLTTTGVGEHVECERDTQDEENISDPSDPETPGDAPNSIDADQGNLDTENVSNPDTHEEWESDEDSSYLNKFEHSTEADRDPSDPDNTQSDQEESVDEEEPLNR